MLGSTGRGWLFSLSSEAELAWGDVAEFFRWIRQQPVRSGRKVLASKVWGTLRYKETPVKGDGFAFYHTWRAIFPLDDEYGGRPRISLIGELTSIKLDGPNMKLIEVVVHPKVLRYMKKHPIVRDETTKLLFEDCGIVQGGVATLYRAQSFTWAALTGKLKKAVA